MRIYSHDRLRELVKKNKEALRDYAERLDKALSKIPIGVYPEESIAMNFKLDELREIESLVEDDELKDAVRKAREHREDIGRLRLIRMALVNASVGSIQVDKERINRIADRIDFWIDALESRGLPLLAYLRIRELNAEGEPIEEFDRLLNEAEFLLKGYMKAREKYKEKNSELGVKDKVLKNAEKAILDLRSRVMSSWDLKEARKRRLGKG